MQKKTRSKLNPADPIMIRNGSGVLVNNGRNWQQHGEEKSRIDA